MSKELRGTSLFSNVGIAESRFKEIGVEISVANEIDKQRAELYRHFYPETLMIDGDITNDIVRDKIVEESVNNEIDFIIATPPCQGMSEAGKRDEFDERNQLISYAVDVIKRVKPKFVFIENVPKQLHTKIRINSEIMLIPQYIETVFSDEYQLNIDSIRCMDHGIPQIRERSIMLLVRKDLGFTWDFPQKEKEITLEEAIGHLPSLDPLLREGIEFTIEKFPQYETKRKKAEEISIWHKPPVHSWKQVEWMMYTPTGKSAIYNMEKFPMKDDGTPVKAHHNNYRRLKWDMPCRTITQNNGVISSLASVHPGYKYETKTQELLFSDPRVLTIYELMIVMSLPLDWNIPIDIKESQLRRVIGEGIPPLLVKKIFLKLSEDYSWEK